MIYAVSDIHGNYKKYRELLDKIDFGADDTLYVLGDVIDRGPDGFKIMLDLAEQPNISVLMGNHEDMAVKAISHMLNTAKNKDSVFSLDCMESVMRWFHNGGEISLAGFCLLSQGQQQAVCDYMLNMPLYKEVEAGGKQFLLVHGGFENFSPERSLSDYTPNELLWFRPEPDHTEYFTDKYVVFGHTPVQLIQNDSPAKIYHMGNLIDIDCGCAYQNGRLGCLCLDNMEEIYV